MLLKNKRTKLGAFLLILLISFTTNIALFGNGAFADGGADFAAFQEKTRSDMPKLMKKYGIPGAAAALIKNGEVVWVQGYGQADKGTNEIVQSDTVFQAASISKTVTAWGVMKLVEQGKLDLNAPVEKYLTRWHLPDSAFDHNQVTISRLLCHTSGLSGRGYAGYESRQDMPTLEQSLSGVNEGEGIAVIMEPGSAFLYSGGGYTLLQLVIEEVTGMTFAEYMEKEILKPLGMKDSAFEWKESLQPKAASAYGILGQRLPSYLYTEKAAAGLYTTAPDLARFAAAAVGGPNSQGVGGGVLKPETLAQMQQIIKDGYGLGYQIDNRQQGKTILSHDGANRGWRSQFAVVKETGDGIVILTNSDSGGHLILDMMAQWIEWQKGEKPGFYHFTQSRRQMTLMAAGVLALGLLAYISALVLSIRKGRRQFGLFIQKPLWKKILRIGIPAVLVGVWWMGLYGPIIGGWSVASFLPAGFGWVTLDITLWSTALIIGGFLPRAGRKKAVAKSKAAM